jgi:uncharacterized protein YuzE
MRLTYDPEANAAYIRLREQQGDVETIQITGDFLVDIDTTGSVCGIELLNANEQLKGSDDGQIVYVNPFSGEETTLKVA